MRLKELEAIAEAKRQREACGVLAYVDHDTVDVLRELIDEYLPFDWRTHSVCSIRPSELNHVIEKAERAIALRVAQEMQ